eukprot:scaffold958_cov325-Prasinococcus_capsulatus_cf.AAC.6
MDREIDEDFRSSPASYSRAGTATATRTHTRAGQRSWRCCRLVGWAACGLRIGCARRASPCLPARPRGPRAWPGRAASPSPMRTARVGGRTGADTRTCVRCLCKDYL